MTEPPVQDMKKSGEWEASSGQAPNRSPSRSDGDLSPGTIIGVEVGPERAIPDWGFAPVVPNDEWEPTDHHAPKWCVRPGSGIVPRLHRSIDFVIFDFALPRYRRCPRCGHTIYIEKMRG